MCYEIICSLDIYVIEAFEREKGVSGQKKIFKEIRWKVLQIWGKQLPFTSKKHNKFQAKETCKKKKKITLN